MPLTCLLLSFTTHSLVTIISLYLLSSSSSSSSSSSFLFIQPSIFPSLTIIITTHHCPPQSRIFLFFPSFFPSHQALNDVIEPYLIINYCLYHHYCYSLSLSLSLSLSFFLSLSLPSLRLLGHASPG